MLQYAYLPLISHKDCEDHYKSHRGPDAVLPPDNICFKTGIGRNGNKSSTCTGDSGGPIFSYAYRNDGKATVIGITSWGVADCGDPKDITFATSISYHSAWISDVMSLYNLRGDITRKTKLDDGYQYFGTVLKSGKTGHVGRCVDACRENAECKYWTYFQKTEECQLFSKKTKDSKNADVISGYLK